MSRRTRARVRLSALAITGALALSACGGGSGGGGGLAVGDCTDFVTSNVGGTPAKVDCSSSQAKSVVTKVAAGAGNSGSCPFGQLSYDDPGASGNYICLKAK